jgi:hypothetical protein
MFEGFGSFISVPHLPMTEGMLESYSRLMQVCQCLINAVIVHMEFQPITRRKLTSDFPSQISRCHKFLYIKR